MQNIVQVIFWQILSKKVFSQNKFDGMFGNIALIPAFILYAINVMIQNIFSH